MRHRASHAPEAAIVGERCVAVLGVGEDETAHVTSPCCCGSRAGARSFGNVGGMTRLAARKVGRRMRLGLTGAVVERAAHRMAHVGPIDLAVLVRQEVEKQPIVGTPVDAMALPLAPDVAKVQALEDAYRRVVLDCPG